MNSDNSAKKTKFRFNFFKGKKINDKIKIAVAFMLFLVIIAIFVGGIENDKGAKKENDQQQQIEYSDYVANIENRLVKVISAVKGVQNVSVFVYVENSPRLVLAEDIEQEEKRGTDGTVTISKTVTTVITKDGSENKTVCIMEIYPEIVGVLVVADGASNEKTRLSSLNAVTVLLGIENTRVEVLEGK